jgi:hypothetical protein
MAMKLPNPSPFLPSSLGSALGRLSPLVTYGSIVLFFMAFSYFFVSSMGPIALVLVLGGLIGAALLAWISLKDLSIALVIWMFSMSGIRTLAMVRMPGLPDFSFDRLLLVWIILLFVLRLILEKRRLEGPYLADFLILSYTVYLLVQLHAKESRHFHEWVISGLSPFFGYLYGKYVINQGREIRNVLIFFVLVNTYYFITSIV